MLTFVFPGQGAQQKGMGSHLFDEFKELVDKADEILGYSIKELCIDDPRQQLANTRYTQPAIYVVSALSYLKKIQETGIKPDYVAGHSLGEYNALFASDAFDFETGLKLVKKRGELMSQASGGGMAAVVGLNRSRVEEILQNNSLESIDIANLNSETQIVIAGKIEDIEKAKQVFEDAEGLRMYVQLKVSGAFHSRYMSEARKEFEKYLEKFTFSEMTIPVISNTYARPYKQSEIKRLLSQQIDNSVRWNESIKYLMALGVNEFVEVGPGAVLSGMIKKIKSETSAEEIERIRKDIDTATKASNENEYEEHLGKQRVIKETACAFPEITEFSLGSFEFKKEYNLKYAYVTGGMYKGIASEEMVIKMGKAGMMGFFGTGGVDFPKIEEAIRRIQKELTEGQAYGFNFLHSPDSPEREEKLVDLFLQYKVRNIEAAAFLTITPALVRYRAKGLKHTQQKTVSISNRIIAKVSRPEVAEAFLSPAPERIVSKLLAEGNITSEEAMLLKEVPVADGICVEADSGGHTDGGVAFALLPAMIKLRDDMMEKYRYQKKILLGAAGGIGTPEAAAAAFILGADFILTGSINQCTVEAATSEAVKDLLQQINVQDTEYVPAGDMFELGAKVQVMKKGLFFPARANKLFELYRRYNSIDEIDEKTKKQIEEKYFKRSFEKVFEECKSFYSANEIEKAEQNPKHKMALIFRWYFGYSTNLALNGSKESRVDYQIHCGPALGAFNQWVKGSDKENWRNRHVDEIGKMIMAETAKLLSQRIKAIAI
ncbi:ACP S-malonyltransferase [Ruminiclostridium josui]|uniref:ACP S-malonyltransferase n=1 Tax=Ruminiclostridium josui TaxID=1499 RepID=UPI0004650087|nr:ACP S-malonyltransferase [Ruminiclostridium josui]